MTRLRAFEAPKGTQNPFAAIMGKVLESVDLVPGPEMVTLEVIKNFKPGEPMFKPQYPLHDKFAFGNPSERFFNQVEGKEKELKVGQMWLARIEKARPCLKTNKKGLRVVQADVLLDESLSAEA